MKSSTISIRSLPNLKSRHFFTLPREKTTILVMLYLQWDSIFGSNQKLHSKHVEVQVRILQNDCVIIIIIYHSYIAHSVTKTPMRWTIQKTTKQKHIRTTMWINEILKMIWIETGNLHFWHELGVDSRVQELQSEKISDHK